MVAYQFGNQLLSHGSDEEILLLRETCVDRLRQLQSTKISESVQTTQAHLHLPANVHGEAKPILILIQVKTIPFFFYYTKHQQHR